MAEINALYSSLPAADEARDAAALPAVAWQMHGQPATTAADLGAIVPRKRPRGRPRKTDVAAKQSAGNRSQRRRAATWCIRTGLAKERPRDLLARQAAATGVGMRKLRRADRRARRPGGGARPGRKAVTHVLGKLGTAAAPRPPRTARQLGLIF
jgi:hypothetical protein